MVVVVPGVQQYEYNAKYQIRKTHLWADLDALLLRLAGNPAFRRLC
jgi:hypothetical protein